MSSMHHRDMGMADMMLTEHHGHGARDRRFAAVAHGRAPAWHPARVTPGGTLTDAEAQYLARIREDCERSVGPGAELLDVRHERRDGVVRLVARYRLGSRTRESAASGETMLAAHTALRARILEDRIRFGFSDLVEGR
jgi:hypothetical protein